MRPLDRDDGRVAAISSTMALVRQSPATSSAPCSYMPSQHVLARRIDERHAAQVHAMLCSPRAGPHAAPALLQLRDPRAFQPAFQPKRHKPRLVVGRDSQHRQLLRGRHFARTKSGPRRAALGYTQGNNRSDAEEGRRKCRNEVARKDLRLKDSACVRCAAARSAPPGGHVCHSAAWHSAWQAIRSFRN